MEQPQHSDGHAPLDATDDAARALFVDRERQLEAREQVSAPRVPLTLCQASDVVRGARSCGVCERSALGVEQGLGFQHGAGDTEQPVTHAAEGARKVKRTTTTLKAVEKLRPATTEIIICTGLKSHGGWQVL